MRAHHCDLVAHSKTGKHRKNATLFSSTRTLFDAGVSSVRVDASVKVTELKLAAHIACHSSVHTVDHFGDIVRDVSGNASHEMCPLDPPCPMACCADGHW